MSPSRGGVALVEDDDRLGAGRLGVDRLDAEVQVPRWISAMSFGPLKSRPAKSAASQPLVTARVAGEVDVDRDDVARDRRPRRCR